ncbi:fumarylacetoacetate hydrolase family protein [Nocardioides guangzhouensis]|uniref:Fumarylacetoacetate hydrolase family protein n=1 Tax=Nocardioides guangzhouensis TaxID=2497878 RepID=A0A4Q4Z970_9ACTN|nr:fumarylacetoacetate hydrolase family protein [Nocardioides guangzhouensis]RYP84015.1 fumarylacetoacetate hydrolase family protein [Nocardioides guangzhouensis]
MRLATARVGDLVVGAVLAEDGLHPLPDGLTVDDLVRAGLPAALEIGTRALAGVALPLAGATLLPPLHPSSVRDFVTFESHVEGVRRSVDDAVGVPDAWYDAPTFYFTNPHAIVGPGAPVRRPWGCRALDFELEVACVAGAEGASWTEAEAGDAIFGYLVLNDWSARDLQKREMRVGLGPAKGKDFCTSIGPWLVTADELADRVDDDGFLDLDCRVTVNGVEVGRDRLAHMGWSFPTMLAYASRDSLVVPGDVLASGTTGGGGCLAELWGRAGRQDPPPLQPGDVVSITVERLGTLTNTVVDGTPVPPLTPFRRASRQTAESR